MPDIIFEKIPEAFEPAFVREELSIFFDNAKYIDAIFERKNEMSVKESIYSLLLLSRLVKNKYPYISTLKIARDPHGKPHFEDSELMFSISHSNGYAAVALSDCKRVGLDIEKIDIEPARFERISTRFFTDNEQRMVRDEGFSKVWTAKEAYAKYLGIELASILQKCDITSNEIKNLLSWQTIDKMIICTCHEQQKGL